MPQPIATSSCFGSCSPPSPPLSLFLSSKVPRVPCRQMQFNVVAPSRGGRPYARPVATTFCRVSPRTVSLRPPRRMAATRAYFLFSFSSSMCRLRVIILYLRHTAPSRAAVWLSTDATLVRVPVPASSPSLAGCVPTNGRELSLSISFSVALCLCLFLSVSVRLPLRWCSSLDQQNPSASPCCRCNVCCVGSLCCLPNRCVVVRHCFLFIASFLLGSYFPAASPDVSVSL